MIWDKLCILNPYSRFSHDIICVHTIYVAVTGRIRTLSHLLASNPGSLSWAERRAWYTLSAHAPKFPEILGIRILP